MARINWAQRLERLFQIDIERCSECGGNLRVIACIENPQLIAKILTRARSSEAATAKVVARGPPGEAISPSSPHSNSPIFLLLYNTYPVRYGLNHSALANALAKEQFCRPNAVIREALNQDIDFRYGACQPACLLSRIIGMYSRAETTFG